MQVSKQLSSNTLEELAEKEGLNILIFQVDTAFYHFEHIQNYRLF